jgi:hypothetical protein
METKIAIQGHKDRWLEVIIALEEMGGYIGCNYQWYNDNMYFYVNNSTQILSTDDDNVTNFVKYTLEEYIKTFGPLKHSQQEIEQLYRLSKECDKIYTSLDKINWIGISMDARLSEDVIREFQDKVEWDCISEYQVLSEDFIREFQDKVNWTYISNFQVLSEDFIREFQDKLDWDCISENQELSFDFIHEFKDKLDMGIIKEKQEQMLDYFMQFFNLE